MSAKAEAVDVWPDYFPDDCPPKDAGPATGTFYRFTKKIEPATSDLTCAWHKYEQRREKLIEEGRACQACGVSVYLTIEAARKKRGLLPGLKKQHLQSLAIAKSDGRLLHTPSGIDPDHYTWWPKSTIAEQLVSLVYVEAPGAA